MRHIYSYNMFEAKNDTETNQNFQGFMRDFWQKIETRFDNFNSFYRTELAMKTKDGSVIDTGLGALIGLAGSLVAGTVKRLFRGDDYLIKVKDVKSGDQRDATQKELDRLFPKSDDHLGPAHQRLLNNDFIHNDLPYINSESDMMKYMSDFYKRGGEKRGSNKFVDGVADSNLYSFFEKTSGKKVSPKALDEIELASKIKP